MVEKENGWSALLSGSNGIRSLALAGGVALHAVNVYVATTILPSVVADIGGLDYYAWNTTLFVVASILGSALSAKLLQMAGPRNSYVFAAILFGLGTLVCAISPSMPIMLIGRFLQGFGGGFLFALSYAMIRIVFDESLWPRAMAIVSGMWGVATLVGPAIGGIFAEIGIWRAAFWSVIPITLLFIALAFAALPKARQNTAEQSKVPFVQLACLTLSVLVVSLGSVQKEIIWNIAGVVGAILFLACLIAVEGSTKQRLLPHGSLRLTTQLSLLLATMALLAITVTSSEIFIPLFFQMLHEQTPLAAGYLAAIMGAGWTIGSISSSGARSQKAQRLMLVAPAICLAGMIILAILVPHPSSGTWLVLTPICLALIAVGFGVGIGWPHLLTRVMQVAPKDEEILTSASITTVQLFATALGAALAGMIANLAGLTAPGGLEGTSNAAFWLFAVFAFAPALALLCIGRACALRPLMPKPASAG